MKAFLQPLEYLREYSDIQKELNHLKGAIQITGCIDAQKPHIIYSLNNGSAARIIVTFSEQKAKELYENYHFFDKNVVYYPAKDVLFYQSDIRGNLLTAERLLAIKAIMEQENPVIITTFDALMDKLIPLSAFYEGRKKLHTGDSLDIEQILYDLIQMGYERNDQIEAAGQFSMRGGILDLFPLTEENPYRIELWGDEIDSIRTFDAESQRSIENLTEIIIYPASETLLNVKLVKSALAELEDDGKRLYKRFIEEKKTEEGYRIQSSIDTLKEEINELGNAVNLDSFFMYFYKNPVSLIDYMKSKNMIIFIDEPSRAIEKGRVIEQEFLESMKNRMEKGYILPKQMDALFSYQEVLAKIEKEKCILLSTLDGKVSDITIKHKYNIEAKTVNPYNSSFEMLIKDLKHYKRNGFQVILLSGSRTRAVRLSGDLLLEGLNSFYSDDYNNVVKSGEIMVAYGKIKKGFEYPVLKFVVIAESDIFGTEKKKKKKRHIYRGEKINSFKELSIGDFVVHENHGLGIYRGIEKVEVENTTKDYIKIEYDQGGNLYILATQLDLIQKYANASAQKPKLNKLGSREWKKTKSRVRGAVKEIAKDLVALYAKRQNKKGFMYGKDTIWQKEFEEMFPFEETEDQVLAIEATKNDMESSRIMDRLICGDVGYGKTEIAIRAAFKAIQDGKQVVYLVPTTILAQQHYNNFSQRMKDFPVRVDLLCRFCTPAQQKLTLKGLKAGTVDIVIGTHRVLSKDILFKDLGLLIIDEEQRFGVTHKEKIKRLKTDIDVLTLTATPIPRTLHMSLIGIRDMSVLEEPPMDRMPIQTYVMEFNEEIIREAISRELGRDGQVYYVFNRVNQIEDITSKIATLVPQANVAFAHGQMRERELENIMYSFINGEVDVLVSTTIIETGLDISNVNTMIIHDADNFGLSQLYQLRGRVGRSNKTAYAFLMYRRNKLLKEVAEKRLSAIKEFTELGSGFKIAMRDLEIRGAGNLLGAQQHGHMEAVGYDLYCKMLDQAVKEIKGEEGEEHFDTSVDIQLNAFIPPRYIQNEFQKLDIYKRIAGIDSESEIEDMLEELIDRFGDPPKSVENLLLVSQLKAKAHLCYYTEINQKGESIYFIFYERARINPAKIPDMIKAYNGNLTFNADAKAPFLLYHKKQKPRQNPMGTIEIIQQILEDTKSFLIG